MSKKRILDWTLSNQGRKVSSYLVGAAIWGSTMASYLPHTIFVDQYRDLVRLYKKGVSVPVSEELEKRFYKAIELAEVDERDRHLFRPFMMYGFDIYSIGTDMSRYGVLVGLPINFTYESVETLERPKISLNQESVIWDSDSGKDLLESLVLSENAQLYAMAREIKFRQTPKVLYDTIFAAAATSVATGISIFLNKRFDLYTKPRGLRLTVYLLVSGLALGNYFFCKDFSQVHYEEKIDKYLKEKNPIFTEGGKEFYDKTLKRNIALRQLMGEQGKKMYTAFGNENNLFRTRHLPLVQRKKFFETVAQVEIQ